MQVDVAFQRDGAGVEVACRDDDRAASRLVAGQDGQIDGFVVELFRIAGHGAEVRDAERAVGELRLFNVLYDLVSLLECFLHGLRESRAHGHQHGE